MSQSQGYKSHLARKHGAEVVATGSQHDAVGREVLLLHSEGHIAQRVALPEGVHRTEDGLRVSTCHDVFGGHDASHQATWKKNEMGPGVLQIQEKKRVGISEGCGLGVGTGHFQLALQLKEAS